MKFNITHAAKAVGKSRRTLQNHIKQGKLSYELDGDGNKVIDTTELLRVYGELLDTSESGSQGNSQRSTANDSQHFTSEVAPILQQQIKVLERENEVLREGQDELKQQLKKTQEHHHKREEKWDVEREKFWQELTTKNLMLEDLRERDKKEATEQPKSSDRWLVWVLSGFTLIVGTIAVAAIYYLIQAGV